ncbi:MAG: sensor histidine kinase [Thermacetogeniaceae bacterium]
MSPIFQGGRNCLLASIAVQAACLLFLGVCIFARIASKTASPMIPFLDVLDLCAGGVFTLLAVFMVKAFVRTVRAETEAELNRIRMRETSAMIDLLRAQRHDFLNHLQVIYGLIQLGRVDAIKEYIEQVNQEILKTSKLFTSLRMRPEIAGLIIRKMAQAEREGIRFDLELKTDLALLSVPPLDFSRIIGNLLDNAISAAKSVLPEERRIRLEMAEESDCYEIRVTNYRPLIPDYLRNSVFEKGFTTRSGEGEGLGLYIVKTLVEKNRGSVSLKCDESTGTTFEIRFPKSLPSEYNPPFQHRIIEGINPLKGRRV